MNTCGVLYRERQQQTERNKTWTILIAKLVLKSFKQDVPLISYIEKNLINDQHLNICHDVTRLIKMIESTFFSVCF